MYVIFKTMISIVLNITTQPTWSVYNLYYQLDYLSWSYVAHKSTETSQHARWST